MNAPRDEHLDSAATRSPVLSPVGVNTTQDDHFDPAATRVPNIGSDNVLTAGALPILPGYQLGELIGRGGMGDVYRALDLEMNREVAVKILQECYPIDSATAARFVEEACITGQLQHPGIPAVYRVSKLADGRPFLAMKLIKGQTLDELLKSQGTVNHLAVMEAVAQAVGYAHAHNVIHRDLKPQNVMVGAFGEVQVMDWGLAKVLTSNGAAQQSGQADPVSPSALSLIRTDRDRDDTAVGSVLGTPAYMSPEQAAGEGDRVGKSTDVFGLGALWCKLLTGEPPFTGSDVESIRRNALHGKTEKALEQLAQCGAEPEAVALCKWCLAAEPENRPMDANELARHVTDLRRAAEERAKQAELSRARAEVLAAEQSKRRRVVLAASGLIALVLMTGMSVSLWQLKRALRAEDAANSSADEARLSAEKADRNAKQARDERDAKELALKAEHQAREDETKARMQAFAALRSMTTEVVERRFAQRAVLTEDDRAFLRSVIVQFDAFAAIKGDDADSRAVRAEGRLRIGLTRYRLGEFKEAEQDFDQALNIFKPLMAEFPARLEFRHNLAACHLNRGVLRQDAGRLTEAEQDYDQALGEYKQLAAEFPSRLEIHLDLATGHNSRGGLRISTGRLKEAEQDYDQALGIIKQLAVDFPSRPEIRLLLAFSHDIRGVMLRETGRLQEAEQDFDQALSVSKQLVAEFPFRSGFRRQLADNHHNRGGLLFQIGRLKEAEQDYDQALSEYKKLAAEFPSIPDFRLALAIGHKGRGILLNSTGRIKEAEQDCDQALGILKRLATDFPSRPDFRQQLAQSQIFRGNLKHDEGQLEEAEKAIDQALGILKRLAADFHSQVEFRQDLADCHLNRGRLMCDIGRAPEAEKDFDEYLSIEKLLAGEFPSHPAIRNNLAKSYNNRGFLQYAMGRLKEAEQDFDQALKIYRQIADDYHNQPELRSGLARTFVNLALVQQRQENWVQAKRLLQEGQPHLQNALKANPRDSAYRQVCRNLLRGIASVHAGLLEQEDAVRAALTRRDLGWDEPADAYDAASFLSLCIPIVSKHAKLNDKQRKEATQFYGDRAMEQLRDAVSLDNNFRTQIETDPDFDFLRGRDDFKKLLESLPKK